MDTDDCKSNGRSSTLFNHFSQGKDYISVSETRNFLMRHGFLTDDPRWSSCYEKLLVLDKVCESSFNSIFSHRISDLSKAAMNELIIPEFGEFCNDLTKIFEECKKVKDGETAKYIPQLGRVDPEKFGMSICTIDGQRFNVGDYNDDFCIQSTSKPITYAIAVETAGEDDIHKHVDKEPSGQAFNSMALTTDNIPYNPMVNSGAIMVCSLVEKHADSSERFEKILKWWKRLAGGFKPGFNNSVYLSERQTADKNFAMAYFMKSVGSFPEGVDLKNVLEFYFQCCSIEMNCNSMAVVASTLANGGICPLTHERVLSTRTTKNVLSLMFSCGMYDYSGQFAFSVGLPAKSGVSGSIMLVVPGVCGICIWSPRLDKIGNSVRGLEFCKELVAKFNFHNFDNLTNNDDISKKDPRKNSKVSNHQIITEFLYACMENDMMSIRRLVMAGVDINIMDYDRRTGLHVAASEGHYEVVAYLIENGADPAVQDRWGNAAIDDSIRGSHKEIMELLQNNKIKGDEEIKKRLD